MRCAQGQNALEEQKQGICDKEQWHKKDIKWLKDSLILLLAAKQKEISQDNFGGERFQIFLSSSLQGADPLKELPPDSISHTNPVTRSNSTLTFNLSESLTYHSWRDPNEL